MQKDRLKHLKTSKVYYDVFLSLMKHYKFLEKLVRIFFNKQIYDELEKAKKDPKYRPGREERVNLYNIEKAAKVELDEKSNKYKQGLLKNYHEFLSSYLKYQCSKAFNDFMMIPMELEMLEYRHKLETDPEAKEEYERQRNKPIPKPEFFKIGVI